MPTRPKYEDLVDYDHLALYDSLIKQEIGQAGEENVIESVSVNNVPLAVVNKGVDVPVPTALTDLTNDGNFVQDASYVHTDNNYTAAEKTKLGGIEIESTLTNGTNLPTGAAVTAYVQQAIGSSQHLRKAVVAVLPATGEADVLYLVPDDQGGSNKDMYIWDGTAFILIGNTETDLTGYLQEDDVTIVTNAQINALFT